MTAAIDETDPRARHQVRHRPRDQHLARSGEGEDLSGSVHGDSAQFPVVRLAFAGVKAGPAPDSGAVALRDDRLRTADRARGSVEGRTEAVPASDQHLTAEPRDVTAKSSPTRSLAAAASTPATACGASMNITVATTLSGSGSGRAPVTSSWISATTGPVSPVQGR